MSRLVLRPGIGDGQSWQDVTVSRAVNTTYTNTTGRAIFVSISVVNFRAPLYVGSSVFTADFGPHGAGIYGWVGVIVPPGVTYKLGVGAAVEEWCELR